MKANVDRALTNPETASVQKVIVCKRTGGDIEWNRHRDIWYHSLLDVASEICAPKEMGPKSRCLSFIPLAQRANRKACCTPRAAICCMPR